MKESPYNLNFNQFVYTSQYQFIEMPYVKYNLH